MSKLVFVAFIGLTGCAELQAVQPARQAVAQVEQAAVVIRSGAPTMTKAQAAACAGQSALNALTDYLRARGRVEAARYSSWGSAVAGAGCEWRE